MTALIHGLFHSFVYITKTLLRRTTLSSAMIQIVDQSADAFNSAEKNMRAIRMQTNVMFGKTGHVSERVWRLAFSRHD